MAVSINNSGGLISRGTEIIGHNLLGALDSSLSQDSLDSGTFVSYESDIHSIDMGFGNFTFISYLGNNKYFTLYRTDMTYSIYEVNFDEGSSTLLYSDVISNTYIENFYGLEVVDENHVVIGGFYSPSYKYSTLNYVTINSDYSLTIVSTVHCKSYRNTSGYGSYIYDIVKLGENKFAVLFGGALSNASGSYSDAVHLTIHTLDTTTGLFNIYKSGSTTGLTIGDATSSSTGIIRLASGTGIGDFGSRHMAILRLFNLPEEEDCCIVVYFTSSTLYVSKLDASSVTTYGIGTLTTLSSFTFYFLRNTTANSYCRFSPIFGTNNAIMSLQLRSNNAGTLTYYILLYNGESLIDLSSELNPSNIYGLLGFSPYFAIIRNLGVYKILSNSSLYYMNMNRNDITMQDISYNSTANSSSDIQYIDDWILSCGKSLYKLIFYLKEFDENSLIYGVTKEMIPNGIDTINLPIRINNLLTNGLLHNNYDSWTTVNATVTVDSTENCVNIVPTSSLVARKGELYQNFSSTITGSTESTNSKIYVSGKSKCGSSSYTTSPLICLRSYSNGGDSVTYKSLTHLDGDSVSSWSDVQTTVKDGNWHRQSGIISTYTSSSSYISVEGVYLYRNGSAYNTGSGEILSYKDIVSVNLTATFGRGNEPTFEWCEQNLTTLDSTMIYNNLINLGGFVIP